jgi:hypothetical protein
LKGRKKSHFSADSPQIFYSGIPQIVLSNKKKMTRAQTKVYEVSVFLTDNNSVLCDSFHIKKLNLPASPPLCSNYSQNYIIQRQADHGDAIFLSETEIRSSSIFEVTTIED